MRYHDGRLGTNSQVFLGLGIPWTIAASHWSWIANAADSTKSAEWVQQLDANKLLTEWLLHLLLPLLLLLPRSC
jgi:biotin-(acetyl-CoA carboxylase) ligase